MVLTAEHKQQHSLKFDGPVELGLSSFYCLGFNVKLEYFRCCFQFSQFIQKESGKLNLGYLELQQLTMSDVESIEEAGDLPEAKSATATNSQAFSLDQHDVELDYEPEDEEDVSKDDLEMEKVRISTCFFEVLEALNMIILADI